MFKDRRFIPIFIVVFVDLLGFSIILPLLPYYAGEFGASPLLIGLLISSYSICQFIAAPVLGNLSDQVGRRPVLIYSQLGSLAGFMLMGLATSLPNPLVWLFVARIIDGLSGGNLTVAQAYIGDISRPGERAKYYGMVIGVSFGLGFLIGPMLGGFLSRFGYNIPAYASAVFSAASVLATVFLLPESQEKQPREGRGPSAYYTRALEYLQIGELRPLLLIFLFMSLPFALYVTMYPLFTKLHLNMSAEQSGYFLGLAGLLGIIWQGGVVGPLVKRIGDYRALVLGLIFSALGLYLLALVDVWWKLIGVAVVFSFGHGITRPPLTSILITRAPPDRRGGVLGATTSIESLSRIVAPVMGGRIVALSPPAIGWIGGIFFSIAVLIALQLHRQQMAAESEGVPGQG